MQQWKYKYILMKITKKLIASSILILCMAFVACEKLPLQKNDKYEQSFYDSNVNMNALEFMKSRTDLFSGMLSAIDYVEKDPNHKEIRKMYTDQGNTYLLLHNNATTNIEDANSFYSVNRVLDTDPASPTYNLTVKGSDWSQYPVERIANMLKYHVLKGTYDYKNLNSIGRWADTYGLTPTNDSAKVWIYMQATREGYLFINNYVGTPTVEIRPRTPDLHGTNGVFHVMARYFNQPTRRDIINNK